jgi:hypothetical protein
MTTKQTEETTYRLHPKQFRQRKEGTTMLIMFCIDSNFMYKELFATPFHLSTYLSCIGFKVTA